MQLYGAMEA